MLYFNKDFITNLCFYICNLYSYDLHSKNQVNKHIKYYKPN